MPNKQILLVEDNSDDEELTLLALRKRPLVHEIIVVRDGAEALAYLFGTGDARGQASHELPTVVFLDLKLPKIDGLEVLRRIRSVPETQLLPVVILTSSREEQDILQCYRLGANSYVQKPVEFENFMAAVQQLGFYWLLVNEPPPRQSEVC
jgi:two-component system response regulator